MRASSCRRAAIEPGKRWMAGGVDAIAANSSGSAAAIASGSTVPKRSRTFAGPRKACSMGYCWSSIMPTSSANAESSRTLSAAGSPVIWKPMGPSCPTYALRGLEAADELADVVLDSSLLEPLLDPGHLVLGGPGSGSVVVLPTSVGVHH